MKWTLRHGHGMSGELPVQFEAAGNLIRAIMVPGHQANILKVVRLRYPHNADIQQGCWDGQRESRCLRPDRGMASHLSFGRTRRHVALACSSNNHQPCLDEVSHAA